MSGLSPEPDPPPANPAGQDATPEDQARDAPPQVLTPEEKRKLGAEVSRTEDA